MKKHAIIITLLMISSFNTNSINWDPVEDRQSTEILSLDKVPIIIVMLNGKAAYFVLDSGSDVTLIHNLETGKYQFNFDKRASKSIIGAAGGNQPIHQASGIELHIAQRSLKTLFYATDLSSVVESLSQSTGYIISGIIGMDLMRRYGFEIDYGAQKVIFHMDGI